MKELAPGGLYNEGLVVAVDVQRQPFVDQVVEKKQVVMWLLKVWHSSLLALQFGLDLGLGLKAVVYGHLLGLL